MPKHKSDIQLALKVKDVRLNISMQVTDAANTNVYGNDMKLGIWYTLCKVDK